MRFPPEVSWTEERVERLKILLVDGLSCSQIAAQLGGVTRNAVIGKIHRHGWHRDRKPGGPSGDTNGARKAALKRRLKNKTFLFGVGTGDYDLPATEKGDLPFERPLNGLTLLELDSEHCHWPCGDPAKPDFLFCGCGAVTGLPYCAYHDRVAHAPGAERRRERRAMR
jgi:GcrA cell cycle regulator